MKTNLLIIVSRLLQGGIDTVLIEYLKHFDRNKFNITLAIGTCMEELEKYICEIPSDIKIEYLVKQHSLIKYRKKKALHQLPFMLKIYDETILTPIRRIIQKRNLSRLAPLNDIIIDFDSVSYSLLKHFPLPKIAFFHFSFKRYHNGNATKIKRLGKKMQIYDRIITACHEMQQEGEELYPYLKEKFFTIYNSLNFKTLYIKASEQCNKSTTYPYILTVSRLEESQKDITTLLKAYKILNDQYSIKEHLCIIGEGPSRKKLQQLCEELNLQNKVHFEGFQINPYPWINQCRLFILSSKFEGFGIVLTEAMVLGRALISTDCPTGPKEILDYGNVGLLTPIGNENKMAEAMYRILSNNELRKKMEAAAKEQVQKFDIQNNIKKIEGLLSTLISR